MKFNFLLLLASLLCTLSHAQNVGIGTSTPSSTAVLDISSNTKGFLPPRMDSTARNAIASPALGLTIYNTSIKAIQCFNGTAWYSTVHYAGEAYGGGIVFYIYDNGQHGLIASTADQSTGTRWYPGTYLHTMATADGIEAGKANTAISIASQGYGDGVSYAARFCNEYSITVGGVTYGDWYLPSYFELSLLYLKRFVVGGFANSSYWSSTEFDYYYAFNLVFTFGQQSYDFKNNSYHVRAIRAF